MRNRIRLFTSSLGVLLVAVSFVLGGCGEERLQFFSIPSGRAAHSLKLFAKQANVEIVFDTPTADVVVTNAVEGKMTPQSALAIMLENTSLKFEEDPETGAYAVTKIELTELMKRSNREDAHSREGLANLANNKSY